MYKVVIIDDEEIIVQGLRRVVDWAAHNCQVVATGYSAATGAEMIRQHQPDIVFTDIKMPDNDGLTMLAGLKGEFPALQITVLTGFRDFEYARRAIELGVSRFLLKPSKMDELEEAVTFMTASLDRARPVMPPASPAVEPQDTGRDEASAANSFLARQAQTYISEHCTERLSLQAVAEHCYVSQWHLSKLLNKHLGQTFYDLLNGERIQQAKRLLEDPALRISEIADRVGYADTAHFSRVFKKCESISANEYRNLHCGVVGKG